jgi:hypothetical protein
MKGAESCEICAAFFQAHVFADHADNIRLLLHTLRKTSCLSHRGQLRLSTPLLAFQLRDCDRFAATIGFLVFDFFDERM